MEDSKNNERIEEMVRRILQESNMDEVTEAKIRKQASNELGLNLSQPHFKALVKQVVEAFLQEKQQQQVKEEEEEEQKGGSKGKEYNEEGDLIICNVRFLFSISTLLLLVSNTSDKTMIFFLFGFQLSGKRKVTIQDFKGKTLVSIREYFSKDGKELPTSKGIPYTVLSFFFPFKLVFYSSHFVCREKSVLDSGYL